MRCERLESGCWRLLAVTEQDRLEAYNAEREERWRYEQALEDRMTDTPRIGRPPKRPQDRIRTTVRQLGRVDDETWAELKKAGEGNFTAWAVAELLKAARRKKKRQK